MRVTLWLLALAGIVYLIGRRRSRKNLIMCAQLICAVAVCSVLGQVVWQILDS